VFMCSLIVLLIEDVSVKELEYERVVAREDPSGGAAIFLAIVPLVAFLSSRIVFTDMNSVEYSRVESVELGSHVVQFLNAVHYSDNSFNFRTGSQNT